MERLQLKSANQLKKLVKKSKHVKVQLLSSDHAGVRGWWVNVDKKDLDLDDKQCHCLCYEFHEDSKTLFLIEQK